MTSVVLESHKGTIGGLIFWLGSLVLETLCNAVIIIIIISFSLIYAHLLAP